ncbi:DUF2461 family protein [Actinoplanes sp. NPDC026619]|uniref:DUF2461 family protein n=1 Tax=Actinoplanes sp. NPDC026619 TaxID=3155798 RepID=UPI0033F0F403
MTASPAPGGEGLFWELVGPMCADPAVTRSTMMGLPCVRWGGRFFAALDRRTGALLIRLHTVRVAALVAAGTGEPFAPAGRTFREWVAVPPSASNRWRELLTEAKDHAAGTDDAAEFPGFGRGGLTFLDGLARENTKAYFDAHREVYRRELLNPSRMLVTALVAALRRRCVPSLRAEPRVGGSLFRISNDLRFRPSRPPYKTHVDMALWTGPDGPRTDPALLIRVTPAEVHLGCGVAALRGPALGRYRAALAQPDHLASLDREMAALIAAGGALSQPTRRRPPPGLERAGRFAVRDGFHVMRAEPLPRAVHSPRFVAWCVERLAPFVPVHRLLAEAVAEPPPG